MGNADAWLLSGVDTGHEPATPERRLRQEAVRGWTLGQLSERDRDFIRGFAPTVTIDLEGGRRLLCFHGSPGSFDDIILPAMPEADFQRLLGPHAGSLLAGGHTHAQQVRRLGDSFFFNPGSVGFSFSQNPPKGRFRADPWADYALLTSDADRLALEFRRLPFALGDIIAIYAASGRPYAEETIAQYQPD
jgi:predicted phosphodiesterase